MMAALGSWFRSSRYSPADFYQFWAVGIAHRLNHALGSPYTQARSYKRTMDAYADGHADAMLASANEYWSTLDLTGTPLLYASFGWLPRRYRATVALFRLLQVAAFTTAVLLLGNALGARVEWSLALCSLLVFWYSPFVSDLRVANLNSLQLFTMTAAIVLVRVARERKAAVFSAAASLTLMVLLAIHKPNLLIVTVAFAICLLLRFGRSVFQRALASGFAAGTVALAVPMVYFGSSTVWIDWFRSLSREGVMRLAYPASAGNYAPVLLAAQYAKIPVPAAAALLAAAMVVGFVCVAGGRWSLSTGFRSRIASGSACFRDPLMAVSAGIVITFAIVPLVWLHYYVWAIIPALAALFSRRSRVAQAMGAAALMLTSGVFARLQTTLPPEWIYTAGVCFLYTGLLAAQRSPLEWASTLSASQPATSR